MPAKVCLSRQLRQLGRCREDQQARVIGGAQLVLDPQAAEAALARDEALS